MIIDEPLSVGLLKCPQCGGPLYEMSGAPRWRRYWECKECDSMWHFTQPAKRPKRRRSPRTRFVPELVPGRIPREEQQANEHTS